MYTIPMQVIIMPSAKNSALTFNIKAEMQIQNMLNGKPLNECFREEIEQAGKDNIGLHRDIIIKGVITDSDSEELYVISKNKIETEFLTMVGFLNGKTLQGLSDEKIREINEIIIGLMKRLGIGFTPTFPKSDCKG